MDPVARSVRPARPYVKSLDGMRGFGIWFVLVTHYLQITGHDLSVLGFSTLWMQMFFVQSGFLITQLLLDDAHRPFLNFAGRFYWRRMLRILPVYCLFLCCAVVAYLIWRHPADFPERAKYLFTFTYNLVWLSPAVPLVSPWFAHIWSLAVEEQFYLIWPVVVYFLPSRRLKILLTALVVLAPFFRYGFVGWLLASGRESAEAGMITYMSTATHLDAFALGAAIPVFRLRERIRHPGRWALVMLGVVLLAGAANFVALRREQVEMSITGLGLVGTMVANLQHVWSYTLFNLMFLFWVLHVLSDGYRGLLNNTWLVRIGKVTYGIYVFHLPVLKEVGLLTGSSQSPGTFYPALVAACLLTLGIAWLSYHYFESRFLDLKDYWIRRDRAS